MFEQPSFSKYLADVANYEYFLFLCVVFGLALALTAKRFFSRKAKPLQPPPLWIIILAGAVLRVPLMVGHGFWFDETFTSAIVQTDNLIDFMIAVRGDVHPPGYYFLIYVLTTALGHSDFVMRLPALLAGVALIPAFYQIGRLHHNDRVGRWSALLVAVLPAAMYYSTEARYPALLALLLALAYIGIYTRRGRLVSLSLAGAALLHVNAWIYIALAGVCWLLLTRRWSVLVLPSLAVLLWFPFALEQAGDVADGFWLHQMPPYSHILEMSINVRFGSIELMFAAMVVTVAVLLLSLFHWRGWSLVWLVFAVLVPLSQWLVGYVWNPIYLPRTLIMSALLLVVPVAWWLSTMPNRWLAVIGIQLLLVSVVSLYQYDRPYNADDAVSRCDGYSTIYATNTKTAVLARHFSDAQITAFIGGNSTDQYLPTASRRALFDSLDKLFTYHDDVCVIAKMSMYNTAEEMNHIHDLASIYKEHEIIEQGELYFVVMK